MCIRQKVNINGGNGSVPTEWRQALPRVTSVVAGTLEYLFGTRTSVSTLMAQATITESDWNLANVGLGVRFNWRGVRID